MPMSTAFSTSSIGPSASIVRNWRRAKLVPVVSGEMDGVNRHPVGLARRPSCVPGRTRLLAEHVADYGRPLRRFRRRWIVERTISWLQVFRRLVTRYKFYARLFH